MTDWKRVIVGDALRLPSRNVNYYRDLFLVWPFLLFTIAALAALFGSTHDYRLVLKFGALALVSILLARERFVLIGVALAFCSVQSLLAFFLRHEWVGLAVAIPSGILLLLLVRALKDHKASYELPAESYILDLLIALLSLGFSIILFRWVGH